MQLLYGFNLYLGNQPIKIMQDKKMINQKNILARQTKTILALTLLLMAGLGASAATTSATDLPATKKVVDFTSTSLDSSVKPGDTSVLNLVVENTGGQSADNVQVWLRTTSIVRTDKTFYIGRMDAGVSKTMPVIFTVDPDAKSGLSSIQVQINFDGYKSDGAKDNNQYTSWEIPINVLGNPLFELTPANTNYFKNTLDELTLVGVSKDRVKDVESTLTSSCLTIIGSSRKYVGDVASDKPFTLSYSIKPSSAGACMAYVGLTYADNSGTKATDNISFGINIDDVGVDFKVYNVSYSPTGPGEQTRLRVVLKNVGKSDAEDVTLNLNLTSPFAPADSTEKYFPLIKAGGETEAEFGIAVSWSADTTVYSIPLTIMYDVGGTSYAVEKDLGVDVSGRVVLEVMQVTSSGGNVRIDVANIGTRTADGVKATLIINPTSAGQQNNTGGGFAQGGRNRTGSNYTVGSGRTGSGNLTSGSDNTQRIISYKSDIKATKQTTFTFATSATGPAVLEIEYTGQNNQRVLQTERVTLGGGSASGTSGRTSSSSTTGWTTYALWALVLAAAYLAYRRYRGRKK